MAIKTDILAGFITNFTTEHRLFREIQSLCSVGHTVMVVGFRDPEDTHFTLQHWKGIDTCCLTLVRKRLPGFLFFLLFMFKLFFKTLRSNAGIYLACDLPALFPMALAARFTGARVVYDSREVFTELPEIHNHALKKLFWTLLEKSALSKITASICVCESDRQTLMHCHPSLTPVIIRNLPCLRPLVKTTLLRDRFSLDSNEPILLFQGTFLTSGGLEHLVPAAAHLNRGKLILIGSGPHENKILSLIQRLGLENTVLHLPPIPFSELHPWTSSASIGICPILPDGLNLENALPNKIFEYAMAGLPMVSTNLPEIRKLNDRFSFALLAEQPTPQGFADAINQLIEDNTLRARLAANARRMAEQLCWENEEQRFLNLFKENEDVNLDSQTPHPDSV